MRLSRPSITANQRKLIIEILNYIDNNIYKKITISEISRIFYFNKDYIMRLFKRIVFTIIGIPFIIYFILNIITHAIVDNLKANQGVINLCFDQVTHIMQIIITWAVLVI